MSTNDIIRVGNSVDTFSVHVEGRYFIPWHRPSGRQLARNLKFLGILIIVRLQVGRVAGLALYIPLWAFGLALSVIKVFIYEVYVVIFVSTPVDLAFADCTITCISKCIDSHRQGRQATMKSTLHKLIVAAMFEFNYYHFIT
jgi:hypothetical protein